MSTAIGLDGRFLRMTEDASSKESLSRVNGVAVGQLGGPGVKLKEGDIVTILPFFAGGG